MFSRTQKRSCAIRQPTVNPVWMAGLARGKYRMLLPKLLFVDDSPPFAIASARC